MRLIWAFLFCLMASAVWSQSVGSFHGVVRDEQGQSLPYATVMIKNTALGAVTDERGQFQIKGIPYGTYEVVVRSTGYEINQATISIKRAKTEHHFILKEGSQQLQEVEVQAERQSVLQERKPIAIKSVDIRDVIAQNTLLTDVADRISGVRIRRSSSLGEKSDISINGMRGTAIRVYIDGLPMEFLYPGFDVSTVPLGAIKRLDVYKGVLPVDVGTDAMGGAVNIITEQPTTSGVRASYSYGSFNTHMADFQLSLANKKNFFASINTAYNYSDNDYSMKAFVYETNKIEKVRRFHDAYQMSFAGLTMGVHSKSWADELRFSTNYAWGYKEMQNGVRIANYPYGQARYGSDNFTASVKYNKSLLDERLAISNTLAYSYQAVDFVDTTRNIYSWSGQVIKRMPGVKDGGEYGSKSNTNTKYSNIIDRATLAFKINGHHALSLSNLYANQRLTGTDYLNAEDEPDYLAVPQYLTKNILGLQYDGHFFDKLSVSGALKRFSYVLDGAENNTFLPVKKSDSFMGWNVGLKYDITDHLYAKASYERGFLIPYFEQFVGNGADILRNTSLNPESSDNVNLGFGYTSPAARKLTLTTNVNAFYREQYDIIFINSTRVVRRYENTDQVRTTGVDGEVVMVYNKNWTWRNNVTWLRKTYTNIKDPQDAWMLGSAFPNNPSFYANTELSWQKTAFLREEDQFRVYAYYQYVAPFNYGPIGREDSYDTRPDLFVPTQHRLDVGASYRFAKRHVTAAFNVINLLDAELYDNFGVPRAGINMNAKLIFEIKNLRKP